MTKEQWLVYLWGVYPNGGFSLFISICLIGALGLLTYIAINYYSEVDLDIVKENYLWNRLSNKIKISLIGIPLLLLFLASLFPDRNTMATIIATPYIVDGYGDVISSFDYNGTKLDKINLIAEKALNLAIKKLEEK